MSANIAKMIQTGLEHHQSGRLQEAEIVYRSILKEQPRHPDALHLLGVLALQAGHSDIAVDLIEKAIDANPGEAEFYNMCGEAYRSLRQYEAAIDRYEKALAINPEFAGAHNNLGIALQETGRLEDAIACYRRAIAITPDFALSHNNLGIALKDLGRAQEACAAYRQAITIMPQYAEAHSNLGNVVQEMGRAQEAVDHHRQALAIRPDYAEAHSNLGNALKALGRYEEAITHYKQALALQPEFAMAHYNLGIALDELGRPQEAVGCYQKALAIKPDYAEAHHNLGNALSELGHKDEAVSHYEKALAIKADYAEAQRNLAKIKPEQKNVGAIEALLASPSITQADAIHCHFALGSIHHAAEAFDKAFEHYQKGNALKRRALKYDAQGYSAYVERLIAAYSPRYFQRHENGGSASQLPVFIVGMPRSGTSLVEQIVASHPQVHGAGELASFGRFEQDIAARFDGAPTYPECMARCEASLALEFANNYLKEIRGYAPDALRITDKMPNNFARIGLIKTLFPQARIIHCRRNALDTCTSNYLNYFATGNDYSFDLRELGQYYLDYEKLMRHWHGLFGQDILAVQYEELILNQEQISRRMIEHIGLEWDDRCLDFHTSDRAVNPFSSLQVRQPVYTHAMNRWRRYAQHLAPLIAMLPDD